MITIKFFQSPTKYSGFCCLPQKLYGRLIFTNINNFSPAQFLYANVAPVIAAAVTVCVTVTVSGLA